MSHFWNYLINFRQNRALIDTLIYRIVQFSHEGLVRRPRTLVPLSKIRHERSLMDTCDSPWVAHGRPIGPQLAAIGSKFAKKGSDWISLWLICVKIDKLIEVCVHYCKLIDQNWTNFSINWHFTLQNCSIFTRWTSPEPPSLIHLTKIRHHGSPMES